MRLELIALTLIASIAACGGEDPADNTPTPTPSASPSPSPSPSPTVAPGPVCERGDDHLCPRASRNMGIQLPGGYADLVRVPHARS